jgi:hypothetical protein
MSTAEPEPMAAEREEGTAMENVEIARVLNEYANLLDISLAARCGARGQT